MDRMSNIEHEDQLIRLQGVTRTYSTPAGEFRALDRVSLTLAKGAFAAVVGRSGSGKSTLVNLIAGLDRPTSGEIWVRGAAVHAMNEDPLATWRGRNVGVVFQFFQLLPTLTIAENVMLPMDFCSRMVPKLARARAMRLLEQVGIADQSEKLPSALSGGQQQRAAIARALANDPGLVVADEPTGNLDAHTAALVLDLLGQLAQEGRTVLIVTHERDVSSRVDRVICLCDGRIAVVDACPREVGHG
jgi:putative ABC transport system ATP-binding protein